MTRRTSISAALPLALAGLIGGASAVTGCGAAVRPDGRATEVSRGSLSSLASRADPC